MKTRGETGGIWQRVPASVHASCPVPDPLKNHQRRQETPRRWLVRLRSSSPCDCATSSASQDSVPEDRCAQCSALSRSPLAQSPGDPTRLALEPISGEMWREAGPHSSSVPSLIRRSAALHRDSARRWVQHPAERGEPAPGKFRPRCDVHDPVPSSAVCPDVEEVSSFRNSVQNHRA